MEAGTIYFLNSLEYKQFADVLKESWHYYSGREWVSRRHEANQTDLRSVWRGADLVEGCFGGK